MRRAGMEPDRVQQAIATTAGDQLVLCPRQWGKSSTAASIGFGDACAEPGRLILLLSRSLRQSGELFRKVKRFYDCTQPMPLVKNTEHELELSNGSRIVSLPASPDTIVGYSAVYRLILDEAARIPDSTYYAVRPMLAMSGGSILALSTPFGQRGWFYEAWEQKQHADHAMDVATVERLLADLDFPIEEYSEGVAGWDGADDGRTYQWTRTCVTAPQNPRFSRRYLAHERQNTPDLWFRQEWLCEFVAIGALVFTPADSALLTSGDVQPLAVSLDGQVLRQDIQPLEVGWPGLLSQPGHPQNGDRHP